VRYSLPKSVTVAVAISCGLVTTAQAALTISNAKTKNVTCTGGVCTPTGSNANLNVGELQTMLASSDVTVKSSAGTPTLGVLDAVTWASTHRLTLDAYQFIHVRAPVVVEGVAGLTLITNDGGSGGDYIFESGGYANFWDLASSLVINRHSYTLVGDVETLASDIAINPSGSYALAASYDATPDGVYDPPPIGLFDGSFEGLGNSISNFSETSSSKFAGLFRQIGSQGAVSNLGLGNAVISAEEKHAVAGALASSSDGYVKNVFGTVSLRGEETFGGLVGVNNGTITSARPVAQIYGPVRVGKNANFQAAGGGLVGVNNGQITDCHLTGFVSGASLHKDARVTLLLGGLAGLNAESGRVDRSSAHVAMWGSSSVGGLIGNNAGAVSNSFATGDVSAWEFAVIGGLIGTSLPTSVASNVFATGHVTKSYVHASAGGLIGTFFAGGVLQESYASGEITGQHGRGGLIARFLASGGVSDNYWDIDTSGVDHGIGNGADPPGITGLTDAQLKSALPAGFDPNVWGQSASINNGWPYLLANPPQ